MTMPATPPEHDRLKAELRTLLEQLYLDTSHEVREIAITEDGALSEIRVTVQPRGAGLVTAEICDNCSAVWETGTTNEITNYQSRVEPGETVPSGECPACGSLTYPGEVLNEAGYSTRAPVFQVSQALARALKKAEYWVDPSESSTEYAAFSAYRTVPDVTRSPDAGVDVYSFIVADENGITGYASLSGSVSSPKATTTA